jgi:2-keto-4-pentenoate hydratase
MSAAARLAHNRLRGERFDRLPDELRPRDAAEAYVVQDQLHGLLEQGGRGPIGAHKIGCTTTVMQEYLSIPSPCAGGVLAAAMHRSPSEFPQAGFQQLGVECELAVILAQDLDAPDCDRVRAAAAIDACMAAIEVVEDRYVDYPSLDTPTLIADDFFNAGCVLGDPRPGFDPLDLDAVRASMTVDGEDVGRGVGSDILGHPLEALAWLASSRAERGRPLRRGDVILLGSVVQTRWIEPGSEVVVCTDGLGDVRLRLV